MEDNLIKRIVQKIFCVGKDVYMDIQADFRLLKWGKTHCTEKIRVGFLVQMAEIWDKQVPVYEELLTRDNVEVFLFVVPPFDFEKKEITNSYEKNYFLDKYVAAVNAIDEQGEIINLKSYGLDYIFYQRPYDQYLPEQLRSYNVSNYCKCCYIPYGFSGAVAFDGGNTSRAFFRNMYFTFKDSSYMQKKLMKKYPISSKLKIRHIENLGYPSLEPYLCAADSSDMVKTVLWTPRWSYDPILGGSHFVEYKSVPFALLEKYKDLQCIFRPHPLMFDELRAKQLMSEGEIAEYLFALENSNIAYDVGTPIDEAIAKSDVLITDFSSIIIMFFLTGKPIIYCKSQIEFNDIFQKMSKYMYIAESEADIYRYIDQLANGNDYLRETREKFIQEEFIHHINSSKRIVDRIISDGIK